MAKGKSWWRGSEDSSTSNSGFWSSIVGKATPQKKRKQLIKPYLNSWEARKITTGVYDDKVFLQESAQQISGHVQKHKPNAKDLNQLIQGMTELYQTVVPDHLVEDIYNIYYNKSSNLEMDKLNDSNKVKFKLLESVNNSLLKIVSNNNAVASFMYTKMISQFLLKEMIAQLSPEELQQLQESLKNSNQKEDEKSEDNGESSEDTDGDGSSGSGKGKGKGKGSSKKNSKQSKDSEPDSDSDDKQDGGGKSRKGQKDNSEEGESDENDNGEDSSDGGDDGSSSGNNGEGEEEDSDSQDGDGSSEDSDSDGEDSNQSSSSSAKQAGKSGHRSNPLTGHNAKEDTSNVKDWKKKNAEKQRPKTRDEALADKIETMFGRPDVQQRLDAAISNADKLMQDLEKAGIDLKNAADGVDQVVEISKLRELRNDIAALTMNKNAIAESIKQVLDNSKNYFSKKYKLKEIDFLEADEIEELYGIENVHPIFRGLNLERISTEEKKYFGKIDLFIDISGSMGSNSGIPGVSNLLFAKSIALAMYNMDLLNNLYTFDTRVTKIEISELNILRIGFGGGTSIETVVRHVVNISKNNAICLTDGEDSVQTYDDRMFFMGTIGVMFSYFSGNRWSGAQGSESAGMKYILNRQCINFDGQKSTLITKELLQKKNMWYGG